MVLSRTSTPDAVKDQDARRRRGSDGSGPREDEKQKVTLTAGGRLSISGPFPAPAVTAPEAKAGPQPPRLVLLVFSNTSRWWSSSSRSKQTVFALTPEGECESEVAARQPPRRERKLEYGLAEARCREPLAPLADRFDVVEPAVGGGDQPEVRFGATNDLFLAQRQPRARELVAHQREVPRVAVPRGGDVDRVERDHVAPEHHRLKVNRPAYGNTLATRSNTPR